MPIINATSPADSVAKELNYSKTRTINRNDFKDNLTLMSSRLDTQIAALRSLDPKYLKILATRIFSTASTTHQPACNCYVKLAGILGKDDNQIFFSSLLKVMLYVKNILINLITNLNLIIPEASITVKTAKVSFGRILSFIDKAECFTNYTVYLLNAITFELATHNGTAELEPVKPYVYQYLNINFDCIATFSKDLLTTGPQNQLNDIKQLISSLDDTKLVTSENTPVNVQFFDSAQNRLIGVKRLFGGFSLNPFRWIGEYWMLLKHSKYSKNVKERESIQSHIDLLKLEADGMDPNSPEYLKQIKIINAYNDIIAGLDKKISDYEQEDN